MFKGAKTMIQTMKCGKIIDSQGRHIHVKFCPICSEEESKKNVILDINNDSKIETKTDVNAPDSDSKIETKTDINLADNDSKIVSDVTKEETKTDVNAADNDSKIETKTDIKEADSDSKNEDDDVSWLVETLGIAIIGAGLIVGLIYLAYRWATQKAGNTNTSSQYVDTGAAMTSSRAQYVDILQSGLGVK